MSPPPTLRFRSTNCEVEIAALINALRPYSIPTLSNGRPVNPRPSFFSTASQSLGSRGPKMFRM
jgi:hypothetical protein